MCLVTPSQSLSTSQISRMAEAGECKLDLTSRSGSRRRSFRGGGGGGGGGGGEEGGGGGRQGNSKRQIPRTI